MEGKVKISKDWFNPSVWGKGVEKTTQYKYGRINTYSTLVVAM